MPHASGVVLSEQVLTALEYIERYRHLTIQQVATVTGLRPKSCSNMLLRLERQKLLGHFGNVPIYGRGKMPKAYFLTRRGHALLAGEYEACGRQIAPYRPVNRTSRWTPTMEHRIATVDVLMTLERDVCALPDYSLIQTFVEYRRKRDGQNLIGETVDHVAAPNSAENRIVPDAGFVLENCSTGRRALFLIEVDRATVTIQRRRSHHHAQDICYKIAKYDRYLRGQMFRSRYQAYGDFEYFTLLFITDGDKHLLNIRRALADTDPDLHQFYRFSTIQEVCRTFFHTAWRSRTYTDDTSYGLIRKGGTRES